MTLFHQTILLTLCYSCSTSWPDSCFQNQCFQGLVASQVFQPFRTSSKIMTAQVIMQLLFRKQMLNLSYYYYYFFLIPKQTIRTKHKTKHKRENIKKNQLPPPKSAHGPQSAVAKSAMRSSSTAGSSAAPEGASPLSVEGWSPGQATRWR